MSTDRDRERDPTLDGALIASDLGHSFGGRRVVDGVSLSVCAGDVIGLLGPNGAGKTTCFQMITGLIKSHEGSVQLGGVVLDGKPLWRRVRSGLGYLPQHPTGFRNLTVRQNLLVPLEAREAASGVEDDLLEQVGLADFADALAGTLSGGERRRLEIARCLATEPRILLLDEPFAGVDPVAVEDLQARIRSLASAGIGILVTDHAVRETLGSCDHAIILDRGKVICSGPPQVVASDPHVRARYLGENFELGN